MYSTQEEEPPAVETVDKSNISKDQKDEPIVENF